MNQRPLVFLAAGRSQVPLLERANALGFATWAFDRDADSPGAEVAARFAAASAHDPDTILARLRPWANEEEPAGVITGSADPGALLATSLVRGAYKLPGPTHAAIKRVLDRGAQRSALLAANVPMPNAVIVLGVEEAVTHVTRSGRAVLKPAVGSRGSSGVSFVEPGPELELRARAAAAAGDGRIVVEELLEGDEYSIDVLAFDDSARVVSITRKDVSENPPLPLGFWTPPDTAEEAGRRSLFGELAGMVAKALELRNTAFNLDVVCTDAGPIVLEVGCLLDAKVDRLLDLAGLDVYGALCQVAVGEVPKEWKTPKGGVASRFLYSSRLYPLTEDRRKSATAMVESLDGRIEWQVRLGEEVRPARSLADTIGWVLCKGRSGVEARDKALDITRELATELELQFT